jgi:hypothetical protein
MRDIAARTTTAKGHKVSSLEISFKRGTIGRRHKWCILRKSFTIRERRRRCRGGMQASASRATFEEDR